MMKAGMIRKAASGIYYWLPYGLMCLKKLENIIRKAMLACDYNECLVPIILPVKLIKLSGRINKFGDQLLQAKCRSGQSFYLAPTSEEAFIDMIRDFVSSHNNFPVKVFQISHKFRDEYRPRQGLNRCKYFLMKDAYSFHSCRQCLTQTYASMMQTYKQIFNSLHLPYFCVKADTGAIGGYVSHEFHIPMETGEDTVLATNSYCSLVDYAYHLEGKTYDDNQVKILTYFDRKNKSKFYLILKKVHKVNNLKISNLIYYSSQVIQSEQILKYDFIVDKTAYQHDVFYYEGKRYTWNQISITDVKDIRFTQEGDFAPDGSGPLKLFKTVEVGHVYQLGDSYSSPMNLCFKNKNNTLKPVEMGCYGIGISRLLNICLERQFNGKNLVLPENIAPYKIIILCLSEDFLSYAASIIEYNNSSIIDDRFNKTLGERIINAELQGYPYIIILGNLFSKYNKIELIDRKKNDNKIIFNNLQHLISFIKQI